MQTYWVLSNSALPWIFSSYRTHYILSGQQRDNPLGRVLWAAWESLVAFEVCGQGCAGSQQGWRSVGNSLGILKFQVSWLTWASCSSQNHILGDQVTISQTPLEFPVLTSYTPLWLLLECVTICLLTYWISICFLYQTESSMKAGTISFSLAPSSMAGR